MKKIFKSFAFKLLIILILTLVGFGYIEPKIERYFYLNEIEKINRQTIEEVKPVVKTPQPAEQTRDPELDKLLSQQPENKYLEVPFICQAPLETEKNWTLHEESCEEAAVLQVYLYENKTIMTKDEANTEILNMIDWQKQNLGSHHDLYADELKQFIVGFYGLTESQIEIIKDASINDIKAEINNGHAVIVPIMGDILNNPYYPYPGYHMLVVKGYTKDRIITNDNGTRRGKDFSYDLNIFKNAMDSAGGDIVIIKLDQ